MISWGDKNIQVFASKPTLDQYHIDQLMTEPNIEEHFCALLLAKSLGQLDNERRYFDFTVVDPTKALHLCYLINLEGLSVCYQEKGDARKNA